MLLRRAVSSYSLAVVSAPAGYGKTTVARELTHALRDKAFYYSFPDETNDSDMMWHALWRAMAVQGMDAAGELQRLGIPQTHVQTVRAVDILRSSPPTVLILDDYHHCDDRAMDAFLETLVQSEATACRLALFSRTRPEVNLEALQMSEVAAVYDQTLLRFSAMEVREYFLLNGIPTQDIADDAWRYTEGWPAALWLCLRSAQSGASTPPSGDIETILETVAYSTYSQAEKDLLRQLSILESFTVSEAVQVSGDTTAGQRLYRLRNKNAFINRHPTRRVYQFHSIFKQFLQKRLADDTTLNTPDLYRRGAECHAARNEYMASYRLLVRAGRDVDSLRLLDLLQYGELQSSSQWEEIHAIVQAIPWRLRLQRPYGYLSYIMCYLCEDEKVVIRLINEFEKRVRCVRSIPQNLSRKLLGEIEYLRGATTYNNYEQMLTHYIKAGKLLRGNSFFSRNRFSWSYSSPHMSFIFLRQAGTFARMVDYARVFWEKGFSLLEGRSAAGGQESVRVEYHLERGELDEAEKRLADIEIIADIRINPTLVLIALLSRARLLLARNRPEEALALMLRSSRRVEDIDTFEHAICHQLALAYIQSCIGHTEGFPQWLADGNIHGPPYGILQTQCFINTVYGKILLARGDYDGLASLVENSPEDFGSFPFLFGKIHRKIFKALLARQRGKQEEAASLFMDVLNLTRPDGIVLSIVEYGEAIKPLLRVARKSLPDDPHLNTIWQCHSRAVSRSQQNHPYKKSLLATRERDVMRLIAKGRTTPSIARSLGLAEVTIKKVLSRSYAKLGAANRVEAVGRFSALYGQKTRSLAREKR